MANNIRTSIVARNAELDALAVLASSGKLRIYSGTQPATPETTASGVLLAELTMNSTAFAGAVDAVITANAITQDSSNDASGTAGYYRLFKSDGVTVLWDGEVGTSGADMNLNSVAISSGAITQVTSFTYTLPQ
jgi:hypothetical protein